MDRPSLKPLQIADAIVPNRIFRPAHQTDLCPDGRIGDRFISYHEARARGGTGLLILDGSPVHRTAANWPTLLSLWDDEAIAGLSKLRRRIEPTAAKVFIQIWHGGANGVPRDGSPPWAPSSISGFGHGIVPIAMTQWMIDEIVNAYAKAAARAAAAGLEGIEVHGGHGYLPQQFLAPAMNLRTDKYGGSLQNRSRFLVEVMRAIRTAVPKGFAVGARLGPELMPGMTDLEDILQTIELLQRECLLDFVNISVGTYINAEHIAAAMDQSAGYQLNHYRGLRSRLRVPLLATGRYRKLDEIDEVLRSGEADMVGMVRAQIADPDLVRKTVEGRPDQVRPCIACNQLCVAASASGSDVGCAVNVAAGREEILGDDKIHQAPRKRKVLVLGGGVSGMEAARVAALRGHTVILCEGAANLGGKVRVVASHAPRMTAFGDITYWQEAELKRLGVEIRLSSFMKIANIAAEAPDVVVLATGVVPRMDGWQRHRPGHVLVGVDRPHVRSSIDTLAIPTTKLGRCAVVQDDLGHYEAVAVADHLVSQGLTVTFVTRLAAFAPLMEFTLRSGPAYQRMHKTGRFQVRTRALLERIDETSVSLFDEQLDVGPEIIPADSVVLVTYGIPNTNLADQIAAVGIPVHRVGDALSPRYIENAMRDAYLAAVSI